MRETFVYRGGRMVSKTTGEPMNDPDADWTPAAPRVQGDIDPYLSPVDGTVIGGNRARRYDMEKHECIDGRDMNGLGGKIKNPRFAAKRGLTVSEEYRE